MKNILLLFVLCGIILGVSIHGIAGNPTESTINLDKWKDNGPFELSPDRGRFALMYSIVEKHSFHFSLPMARFATPDLGYINGNYVSLFAPALSFLIIPGYLLGKYFTIAQVGTFAIISLFAIGNTLLIRSIGIRLGANKIAASIASLVFLFATPAYAYAVTLYQHHVSTFLLLISIYLLLRWNTIWSLMGIWFCYMACIPVDNPNFFLTTPIALMALWRIIFIKKGDIGYSLNIKIVRLFSFLIMIIPFGFFLWVNQLSYGSPFQLAGTIKRVQVIGNNGKPNFIKQTSNNEKKDAIGFFNTRDLLNGFYVHLLSPDRGILYFAPVIFLSILGGSVLYKKTPKIAALLISVIGINVLLYSMWGDPWGGWAFGSRYLIPTYAILAIFLAFALSVYRKNILFMLLFILLLFYSVSVNTIGALTSNRNPPQVEVLALQQLSGRQEKYTFERDLDLLKSNFSKSFVWQTYASSYMTALQYYWLILAIILAPTFACIALLIIRKESTYDIL